MQTFLPYPSFMQSLMCLDNKRLGKQRVEAMQILNALEKGPGAPWYNHPAAQMWKDYIPALKFYHDLSIDVWKSRGFKNTMSYRLANNELSTVLFNYPDWWGEHSFHLAHQSNLLRKMPEHYRTHFPDVPDDLPYIWPSKQQELTK